jgi:hypothetical protein
VPRRLLPVPRLVGHWAPIGELLHAIGARIVSPDTVGIARSPLGQNDLLHIHAAACHRRTGHAVLFSDNVGSPGGKRPGCIDEAEAVGEVLQKAKRTCPAAVLAGKSIHLLLRCPSGLNGAKRLPRGARSESGSRLVPLQA